jgi:hypothetical protein
MILNTSIRSIARKSVSIAIVLAAPIIFGKVVDRPQVQAQLLDHAEILCDNCFFGPSYYYFCFAADNKILVGYQRIPVINWRDTSKNDLTRVHRQWTVWTAPGETLPISYDDKNIWVSRPDGKQVKLIQTYTRDVFTDNAKCRDAVRAKTH